ncbi:MAG: hypothetical protein Q8O00_04060 [Holophaga sp.]|nr:hypothetical protein [Holophaga sp.]
MNRQGAKTPRKISNTSAAGRRIPRRGISAAFAADHIFGLKSAPSDAELQAEDVTQATLG